MSKEVEIIEGHSYTLTMWVPKTAGEDDEDAVCALIEPLLKDFIAKLNKVTEDIGVTWEGRGFEEEYVGLEFAEEPDDEPAIGDDFFDAYEGNDPAGAL